MTEPVPGGFGDNFPDYSYGSSLFINVLAYDPDGDLEYVSLSMVKNETARAPDTYVGKLLMRPHFFKILYYKQSQKITTAMLYGREHWPG